MSGCAAVGCSNRGDKGFLMKSFPRDPQRRAIWASKINRDCWQPNDHSRLCEVHFDDNQWEKTREDGSRRLKCSAVPTLFDQSKERSKTKVLNQKNRKRFIIPNEAPEKTEEYSAENLKLQNVGKTEENRSLVWLDCEAKSKLEEKSVNPEAKQIWKSILKQQLSFNEKNESQYQARSQNRSIDNQTDKLTSFIHSENQNPNSSLIDRSDQYNSKEIIRNTNLIKDIETKDCRDSNLRRNPVLSNITKLGDICCRLCATKTAKNYFPIFGDMELAEKISRCLPIIVLPTDKLPLKICQDCLFNLNVTYKLIIGSLEADFSLRLEYTSTDNRLLKNSRKPAEIMHKKLQEIRPKSTNKDEPLFRINGPIRCDICDEFFKDMNLFDEHIETRHLFQWRCSFCDHSFETSQELIAHKTLSHSGQISKCRDCEEIDKTEEIVIQVPGNNGEDRIKTENIGSDSVDDNSLAKKIEETKVPHLNCTKCKMVFEDGKQFRKHHTIHLPRRIKCNICLKRCPSVFDYLMHVKVAHNQSKRKNLRKRNTVHCCKYCKKVFLNKQQLISHLRKHKKEMMDDPSVTVYKCVTCPKKFVDRALYQKHRNVHDPDCWHKFRCNVCNRSFMDKFKLKIHQSIHEGAKPYQCDVCNRMFNRNANMIRHRAKHFEQTCRHCDNTFTNSQSLREHLKDIHGDTLNPKNSRKGSRGDGNKDNSNGDDYFICGYCGKQLNTYYSLLDHERIHTGDKPYICQHCGKAFRSITARWDHVVRHEKGNYICELCGKSMSNKLNLSRHLRKHAAIEEKRFECKECGKLFHLRWKLNAHLIRIHHSAPSH